MEKVGEGLCEMMRGDDDDLVERWPEMMGIGRGDKDGETVREMGRWMMRRRRENMMVVEGLGREMEIVTLRTLTPY